MPLVERFDGLAAIQPQGLNDKTVGELQRIAGKVSSPELASLAAKYLDFEMTYGAPGWTPALCAKLSEDIRSLAASVLAQAEGTPRK